MLTAVALGWLLYRGAVRINLAMFFTWTGVLLILVAAGILKYGVHDLQEAGVLPGLNTSPSTSPAPIPPDPGTATLLDGMFNFTPHRPCWRRSPGSPTRSRCSPCSCWPARRRRAADGPRRRHRRTRPVS